MKKKQPKSLIPNNIGVPIAIIGAIILVAIILWQFVFAKKEPRPESAAATAPAAAVPAAPPAPAASMASPATTTTAADTPEAAAPIPATPDEADLQVLQDLLKTAQAYLVEPAAGGAAMPPLAANPFSPLAPVQTTAPPVPEGMPLDTWLVEGAAPPETLENYLGEPPGAPGEERLTRKEQERQLRLEGLLLSATITKNGWGMAIINDVCYHLGEEIEGFTIKRIDEKRVVLQDDVGETELFLAPPYGTPPRMQTPVPAEREAPEEAEVEEAPGLSEQAEVTEPAEETEPSEELEDAEDAEAETEEGKVPAVAGGLTDSTGEPNS
ncbi:MAG: hypothetical protein HYV26_07650 [Candidatus Hydrogenedentes bacterium]|nr:hypothetical protein [Candidatus Hydrogenedentota bacterium]